VFGYIFGPVFVPRGWNIIIHFNYIIFVSK
jgi:hypothetical protein